MHRISYIDVLLIKESTWVIGFRERARWTETEFSMKSGGAGEGRLSLVRIDQREGMVSFREP